MKLIKPITMTDSLLDASNVAENDYAEYDESTTYASGAFVIVLSTHKIYRSVQAGNLGNDPTTDDGTWWVEYSSTNRWKAFDGKVADQTTNSNTITYEILPVTPITAMAFFNLTAKELRVYVEDDASPPNTVFDETVDLVDASEIIDWYTFFTIDLTTYQDVAFISDIPGINGYRVYIEITNTGGTAGVGEIAMGRLVHLGETLEGTEIGLESFSTKEQDSFGNWTIVSRAKSDPITFQFSMPADDAARVKRNLDAVRDTPAVYLADPTLVAQYGAMTIGVFQEYRIPLVYRGISTVTLEIEGLT